uniref:Uncharacterized protein n=1 Tax=Arundo donax TaxID=35708 RepID=A0A0A9HSU9_ARUDO
MNILFQPLNRARFRSKQRYNYYYCKPEGHSSTNEMTCHAQFTRH